MKRLMMVGAVLATFSLDVRAVAAPEVDPSRAIVKLYVTTVARDLFARGGPDRATGSRAPG